MFPPNASELQAFPRNLGTVRSSFKNRSKSFGKIITRYGAHLHYQFVSSASGNSVVVDNNVDGWHR